MSDLDSQFAPRQSLSSAAAQSPLPARVVCGLGRRLTGPGGFYNVGNALGLLGGLTLQVAATSTGAGLNFRTGGTAALDYLAGSASAVAVTLAMLVFFWSGEVYHRAWAGGFPPERHLNRFGDLLSGYGALLLGLGLLLIGEPLLAATAGLLHALGKFGSAYHGAMPDHLTRFRPDPFRSAVLASRLPAVVLVVLEISEGIGDRANAGAIAAPALLLVCYLLWARADLLLFRSEH